MLAARAHLLLAEGGVEEARGRERELAVGLRFELEHFQRVERHQVVEVRGRRRLHLLEEARHACFVLEGQLQHGALDRVPVELEAELDVVDVVVAVGVVGHAHVHGALVVLGDLLAHVLAVADPVARNPGLDLRQPLARPDPADVQVRHLQEDRHQPPTHREVVVFEGVPLWFGNNILCCVDVDHNSIRINLGYESVLILMSHVEEVLRDKFAAGILYIRDKFWFVRFVTYALEKLDALLSFQIFKSTILSDKRLLLRA